jgi:hypothetical protein
MLPESEVVQTMVLQLATLLGVADQFQVSASPDGDHII